jgi:hypothetical protein
MFTYAWNDPQTLWLNITNIVLGLVTLACVGLVGFAVWRELRGRLRKRQTVTGDEFDAHVAHFPELGLTMADGGEPYNRKGSRKPKTREQ